MDEFRNQTSCSAAREMQGLAPRKFHGAVRTSRIGFLRNLTQSRGVGGLSAKWEEAMWLALAAITLAVAIGFCFLALAIQDF